MIDPAKSLRVVLGWQVGITLLLAVLCAFLAGLHGAISALLGGAVAIAGGLVYLWLASPQKTRQTQEPSADMAWDGLTRILKAEGAKVAVIVVLLWLVLANYKEVVMLGFIGTFAVAVMVFSMAVFIRNPVLLETGKNNVN